MAKAKKEATEEVATDVIHYQEWEVKIVNNKPEKLKVKRDCVKITDEQAEILNEGVAHGGNTYALMYFKPE